MYPAELKRCLQRTDVAETHITKIKVLYSDAISVKNLTTKIIS